MRRLWGPLVTLAAVALACLLALAWWGTRPEPVSDTVALNDAAMRIAATWPRVDPSDVPEHAAVVDVAGSHVAARDLSVTSAYDAARRHLIAIPLRRDDHIVGILYALDPAEPARTAHRQQSIALTLGVIAALVATGVGTLVWIRRRVLTPIDDLSASATRIARGVVEVPLPMRRGLLLGTLTEAFDVMRAELRASREREIESAESRRTLIASIGHDIRTPLTTIKTTAATIGLIAPEAAPRLATIDAKTDQITALLDDLAHADSGADGLAVEARPLTTAELTQLVRDADTRGRVQLDALPAALISVDPRRLLQVLDNVLSNAAKYAGTDVEVSGHLIEEGLILSVADRGPGVPDDEMASLAQKGYSAANAVGHPGSGLGLYTATWLMQRMGGVLELRPRPGGGLVVDLLLPKA